MKALTCTASTTSGAKQFRIQGRDAIIKVTAYAICGSDPGIFDGMISQMEAATCPVTKLWEKWSRSAPASKPATRRSGRRALHDLIRRMLLLQERILLRL